MCKVGDDHLRSMEALGNETGKLGRRLVQRIQSFRGSSLHALGRQCHSRTFQLQPRRPSTREGRPASALWRAPTTFHQRPGLLRHRRQLFAGTVGALLFLTNITSRLAVLVENARRLPKQLPLVERVKGTDELTYLDNVLHEAAKELKNSAEQRQYLMQMVAHDLRSPLMSAQVALYVLLDPRAGELSDVAKRQIWR